MRTLNENDRELLFAELELHKVEFVALKSEVARWEETERQFLNLSIVAAGAGIGLTQIVGGQQIQIVLLLAPLVFHVFFREMLECTRHVTDISKYLTHTLIPRVNAIVDTLDTDEKKSQIWWYEYQSATNPLNLFLFIVQPMRYWIPVSAIIALLLVYWANAVAGNYPIPPFHVALIVLNVVYLFTTILKGGSFYQRFKSGSEQIRQKLEKNEQEHGKHKAR